MHPEQFSAGGLVLNPDGKIVIVSNRGITWSFPKGHIEGDETKQECALREVKEETGISNISIEKKLGSYVRPARHQPGPDTLKEITLFLMRTSEDRLDPEDANNPEARWVTIDEAIEILSHPEDAAFLESIRDEIK